jgi:hypothetical protein
MLGKTVGEIQRTMTWREFVMWSHVLAERDEDRRKAERRSRRAGGAPMDDTPATNPDLVAASLGVTAVKRSRSNGAKAATATEPQG